MDEPDDIARMAEERDLIARAQAGDEHAFGRLMQSHYDTTFRLVQSIVRDEHAARDVCQEIWLSVWKNLGKFRGESKFSTWMHPVAVRRAIDHLRSRKRWYTKLVPFLSEDEKEGAGGERQFGAAEAVEPTDPRQLYDQAESKARFERAIASIPPKHRGVLALREIQGLSYDEIAAELGIARGTVMSRLFHARRILAQKLKDPS